MIQLRRILLPTDFSEHARSALPYACAFAEQYGAELHLLHVVDVSRANVPIYELAMWPENFEERVEAHAREELARVLEPQRRQGHPIVCATRKGTAFSEIVRYAAENAVDVIVISTHGRTGLSHFLIGSVAERVVRMAPCPVLTVRPSGHQFVMP